MSTPPDFAYFCVIETYIELRQRYGVSNATLYRFLREMPQPVIEARRAAIFKRRSDARKRETDGRWGARNPVGVTVTKSGPKAGSPEMMQRAADKSFLAHYVKIAKRNKWLIWPYQVAA